jgi:16S rRNA (guanine527-N7)-methyltransferase
MCFAAWPRAIFAPGGLCLFPKGETFAEEVAAARKSWQFDLEAVANPGHKGSALLVLQELAPCLRSPRNRQVM